jgi:type I restriction enzyme S subunit
MRNQWPRISLSELLRLERRPITVLPNSEYAEIGIYCFGRGIFHKKPRTGLEVGDKDLFMLKKADFILQVTFAWEGAVAIVSDAEDGMYGSTRYPTFRVDEDRCVPQFLLHYFKTKEGLQQLINICPGSAGRNRVLNIKRIHEIFIPLPSIPEQQRIVDRIEELNLQVNEALTLRRQARDEAGALMKARLNAIAGQIDVSGTLGDVLRGKPRNGWSASCDNAIGGIPVLSLGAVTGYRYRRSEFKRTSLNAATDGQFWLKQGDLLITRSNTPELVGHAAIYDGSPSPCIYPDLMMRLELIPDAAETQFVWYWLQSSLVRKFIVKMSKGTSPTMKKISQGIVMQIPFPTNLTVTEQGRIIAELDALQSKIDALTLIQAETTAELDALLPSVLSKAFSGQLL